MMYHYQIIPKLRLSSGVMMDIRDNVAVGRTVTVHEKTINYKGWSGAGYIVLDPESGVGAYLIGGGADGGWADYPFLSDYDSDLKDHAYNNVKYGKKEYSVLTNFHPSAKFSNLKGLNVLSRISGYVGLLASTVLVFNNDSLSDLNKIGQISTNMLAFSIISSLAIVAHPLGLISYLLGIILISALATVVNANIFSYHFIRRNDEKEIYYA